MTSAPSVLPSLFDAFWEPYLQECGAAMAEDDGVHTATVSSADVLGRIFGVDATAFTRYQLTCPVRHPMKHATVRSLSGSDPWLATIREGAVRTSDRTVNTSTQCSVSASTEVPAQFRYYRGTYLLSLSVKYSVQNAHGVENNPLLLVAPPRPASPTVFGL